MSRALILASGGVTGGAWAIGVLKGLQDLGIDLTDADFLGGSSVGASIAALILFGMSVDDVLEWRLTPRQSSERSASEQDYFQDCLKLWAPARQSIPDRIELGRRALDAPNPILEAVQIANMKSRLPVDSWPARTLEIGAVDVLSGAVRFFDQSQGVPLSAALAASSAQPGQQAPITIDGRQYMDGGVAGTNIEAAAGCTIVVAVAAFPAGEKTASEIEEVRAKGGTVFLLSPDSEAREVMGRNLSDYGRARASAQAGIRQSVAFATTVRAHWAEI